MIYVKVNSRQRPNSFKPAITLSFCTVFSTLLLPVGVWAEPFQHKFGELREYHKHWLAVCPNSHVPDSGIDYSNSCWAVTHTGSKGFFLDSRLTVLRNRQNGTIKTVFLFDDYAKLDRNQQVSVRFSNRVKMDFAFGTSIEQHQSVNEFIIAAENPKEMLSAMKASNWMQLNVPTSGGVKSINYSMIGLTSALEFAAKYARPKTN